MTDYWETIGRLATYKDFNDDFQNRKVSQAAPKEVSVPRGDTARNIVGLAIDGPDYQQVQDIISPYLTEQFLSLFSAGELFRTFMSEESRQAMEDLIGLISRSTPELFGPSTSYFIALGLIIVDKNFRESLMDQGSDSVSLLPRLSVLERQLITNLLNTENFSVYAADLAKKPWDHGCDVALRYWPGYLQPIPVDAPPKTADYAVAVAY